MSTNPTKPEPSAEEKAIAKQLASWRKEIARLQDLIASAEPASAQDELRAAFESKYGPKDSFAWRNEDGSYKVTSLQIAWELWQNAAQWQATRQAAAPLVTPDADGSPCHVCGADGAHLCEKSANSQAAPSDLQAAVMALPLPEGSQAHSYGHSEIVYSLDDVENLRQAAAELVAGAAPFRSEHHIIADFLARTGQYVTNDASREAAIRDAIEAHDKAKVQTAVGVPLVPENVPADRFENAIREFGISAACEWFDHAPDSEFTKETIEVLSQRLAAHQQEQKP